MHTASGAFPSVSAPPNRKREIGLKTMRIVFQENFLFLSEQVDTTEIGGLPSPITESNGLLEVGIEEYKVVTRTPDFPSPTATNPYVDQTPKDILEREMEAAGFALTGSSPDTFTTVPPPQFTEPSFVAAVATFRYLRWKRIKWRVQGVCSPFVYGWYGLTCCPNNLPTRASSLRDDYGYLSHSDSVIVDMSSAAEVIVDVPWLFNTQWLDLDRLAFLGGVPPNVWSNIKNLNSLKILFLAGNIRCQSSTIPIQYGGQVLCKMEGVEVAGPRQYRLIPPPALSTTDIVKDRSRYAKKTFKSKKKEDKPEYQSGIGLALAGAAGSYLFDKFAGAAEKQAGKVIEQGVGATAEAASDWVSSFLTEDDPEPGSPLVQESESESSNVIPNVYGCMNISRPTNVLGQGTMVIQKGKARKHSILREIQKPSLVLIETFAASDTDIQLQVPFTQTTIQSTPPSGSPDLPMCSRLRFFSTFYRYWRGSVNYTFVLISSPLVTWKMKFTLVYGTPALPTIPILGDIPGDVVTVKGTTIHTVTVPYLATNEWISTVSPAPEISDPVSTQGEVQPTLFVSKLVPPVSSGDVSPVLSILVYESAGPDFKFASPQESRPVSSSGVQYQMRVSEFGRVRAPAQGHPYSDRFMSDSVMTVEDLAKKWSVRPLQVLTGPCPNYTGEPIQAFDLSILDSLSTLYFYWRGQMKFKTTIDPDYSAEIPPSATLVCKMFPSYYLTSPNDNTKDSERFGDGCHVISGGLTQCLTFTTPFLSNAEYLSTLDNYSSTDVSTRYLGSLGATNYQKQAYLYTDGSNINYPLAWVAVAAGDDFTFSFPMPPPCQFFRWYDAAAADFRSVKPQISQNHSAGLARSTLVRPMTSVAETSELLRQALPLPEGMSLHI